MRWVLNLDKCTHDGCPYDATLAVASAPDRWSGWVSFCCPRHLDAELERRKSDGDGQPVSFPAEDLDESLAALEILSS